MWSGLCVLSHGGPAACGVVPQAPARLEAVMRRGLKVVVLAVLAGARGMAGIAEANGDTGDTVVLAGGTYTGVALTLNASMSLVAAPGAGIVGNGSGLTVTASTIEGNGEGISTSSPATVTESTLRQRRRHLGRWPNDCNQLDSHGRHLRS
jgi:hypothetical protein